MLPGMRGLRPDKLRSRWLAAALPLACLGERGPVQVDETAEVVAPPTVVVAPPTVVVAPPEPDVPPVAESPVALHLVAQRDGPLQLHAPAADAVAVIAAPAFALLGPDDRLRRDPGWVRGLAEAEVHDTDLLALAFDGDRPTWLVTWSRGSRMGDQHLVYRWIGDRWQRVRNESDEVSWHYSGIAPWHGGQLGLRVLATNPDSWILGYEGDEPYRIREQEALLARLARNPPRFEVVSGAVQRPPPRVPRDLEVTSFRTLPAGDVVALVAVPMGSRRDIYGDPVMTTAVARWAVGATGYQLEPLPGLRPWPTLHLSPGTAPGATLVHGDAGHEENGSDEPYLVSDVDGVWTELEPPDGSPILSLAVAAGEVLWAVSGREYTGKNQLWRRGDDGPWRRVDPPPVRFADDADAWEVEPTQVHVRGADDLWVAGRTEAFAREYDDDSGRHVVLRSRPAAAPLELPGIGALHAELSEWMALKPWRPGTPAPQRLRYPPERRSTRREQAEDRCRVVFVTLGEPAPAVEAKLVAAAPKLAEKYALTVDLAEVRVYDRVVIGMRVVVPGRRQAAVPAFVTAVARASPGLRPLIRCHDPKVLRSFGPPGVPQPEPPSEDDEDEGDG
jgi:hypothetical protein